MNGDLYVLHLTDPSDDAEETRLFYAQNEKEANDKAGQYRKNFYPGYRMNVERVDFRWDGFAAI